MTASSRWTIVIFSNETRQEVEVLTREDGNRRIFYFANSFMVTGMVLVIEIELVWLLANDLMFDAGIPPELWQQTNSNFKAAFFRTSRTKWKFVYLEKLPLFVKYMSDILFNGTQFSSSSVLFVQLSLKLQVGHYTYSTLYFKSYCTSCNKWTTPCC